MGARLRLLVAALATSGTLCAGIDGLLQFTSLVFSSITTRTEYAELCFCIRTAGEPLHRERVEAARTSGVQGASCVVRTIPIPHVECRRFEYQVGNTVI
jgi:hypothetical protein